MRRGNDGGWLLDKEGRTVAINLGADFCAEHEWGIKGLRQAFGLSPDEDVTTVGISRRTATKIPPPCSWRSESNESLYFEMTKKRPPTAALVFSDHGYAKNLVAAALGTEKINHNELFLSDPKSRWNEGRECNLATAWSEGDFGVLVRGLDYCNRLQEIWDAIQKMDVAIWVGGGGVFENGGLVVAIRSRCPEEGIIKMLEADKERFALQKAADASGIADLLKKAGRRWFSLAPKQWNKEKPTEPLFWLNPCEQQKYDSGWFNLDDLRAWAEDKGRIVKQGVTK